METSLGNSEMAMQPKKNRKHKKVPIIPESFSSKNQPQPSPSQQKSSTVITGLSYARATGVTVLESKSSVITKESIITGGSEVTPSDLTAETPSTVQPEVETWTLEIPIYKLKEVMNVNHAFSVKRFFYRVFKRLRNTHKKPSLARTQVWGGFSFITSLEDIEEFTVSEVELRVIEEIIDDYKTAKYYSPFSHAQYLQLLKVLYNKEKVDPHTLTPKGVRDRLVRCLYYMPAYKRCDILASEKDILSVLRGEKDTMTLDKTWDLLELSVHILFIATRTRSVLKSMHSRMGVSSVVHAIFHEIILYEIIDDPMNDKDCDTGDEGDAGYYPISYTSYGGNCTCMRCMAMDD